MKTSASQFDIMITYMEMNGDLSRPTGSAMGRARTIRQWEELRSMLNADPTGDPKPAEKWKKVWSDFKLNTKKKAARINRAISGTGGGPGVGIHLSAAEERVLKIIGPQAATGITTVVEAGLQLMELAEPDPTVAPSPPLPQLINTVSDETYCSDTQESQNCTNVFYELADASLCAGTVSDTAAPAGIAGPGETTDPGDAANLTDAASPANAANLIDAASPANAASPADVASSANGTGAARRRRLIMTPQRRVQRRGRPTRSPRRRLNANEEAAQHFLNADAAYRQFERERAIREEQRELRQMAMRERELEIRERELALTARWQEIADRLLDIANEYVSRI